VNVYRTAAGVLRHIAYWDIRVLVLADKIDRGEPWVPRDAEPDLRKVDRGVSESLFGGIE
jgi:hypothetical protein